ncbi:hypothetical protein HK102_004440 [Quaeritorhiza haematococci]|nr:hypothetical protein HK102_004440 [Quaeritorhiza haematococci]
MASERCRRENGVAKTVRIGEDLFVDGDVSGSGTLAVSGITTLLSTTDAVSSSTGALVVSGGVGIAKDLHVDGSAFVDQTLTVTGDLLVRGTTTVVESQTFTVTDNILTLNAGPGGSSDSGMVLKRYQNANNAGTGDVVTRDTPVHTGTAQSGTTTTIVLAAAASSVNNFYKGHWIRISAGTGQNQVWRIKSYLGLTRTATIFTTNDQTTLTPTPNPVEGLDFQTAPDNTSVYQLFRSQFVAGVYQEVQQEYTIGYCAQDPSYGASVTVASRPKVHVGALISDSTVQADSITGTGSGVNLEDINVTDSAITGVMSINGNAVDQTVTVAVSDTDIVTGTAIPATASGSSYMFLVSAVVATGAHATFVASASGGAAGNVVRLTSATAASLESLTVRWPVGSSPLLVHAVPRAGGTGSPLSYRVKIIRV